MPAAQKPCKRCGAAVILAAAPSGGTMPLEPYPDPAGRYWVTLVLGRRVVIGVVRDDDPATRDRYKRYQPHSLKTGTCVPAGRAAPRAGRPTQTSLFPITDQGGR